MRQVAAGEHEQAGQTGPPPATLAKTAAAAAAPAYTGRRPRKSPPAGAGDTAAEPRPNTQIAAARPRALHWRPDHHGRAGPVQQRRAAAVTQESGQQPGGGNDARGGAQLHTERPQLHGVRKAMIANCLRDRRVDRWHRRLISGSWSGGTGSGAAASSAPDPAARGTGRCRPTGHGCPRRSDTRRRWSGGARTTPRLGRDRHRDDQPVRRASCVPAEQDRQQREDHSSHQMCRPNRWKCATEITKAVFIAITATAPTASAQAAPAVMRRHQTGLGVGLDEH